MPSQLLHLYQSAAAADDVNVTESHEITNFYMEQDSNLKCPL